VRKLQERLKKEKPQIALIADVRFPNEMKWIKDNHGECVRVDRPDLPPLTKDSHYSELALANVPDEDWTRILVNNRGLEHFKANAVDAFDTLMTFFPFGYGYRT
jgi:hypothetical protein